MSPCISSVLQNAHHTSSLQQPIEISGVVLIICILERENQGSERLRNVSKVTQLVSSRARQPRPSDCQINFSLTKPFQLHFRVHVGRGGAQLSWGSQELQAQ